MTVFEQVRAIPLPFVSFRLSLFYNNLPKVSKSLFKSVFKLEYSKFTRGISTELQFPNNFPEKSKTNWKFSRSQKRIRSAICVGITEVCEKLLKRFGPSENRGTELRYQTHHWRTLAIVSSKRFVSHLVDLRRQNIVIVP